MSNLPAPATPVLILDANSRGRDFVVGDVHGAFDLLETALDAVQFDRSRDRLLSTGDLVDRGEASADALHFLQQPWFYAVLGNHEANFVEFYNKGPHRKAAIKEFCQSSGRQWWLTTKADFRHSFLQALAKLPYIIETSIGERTIGILHAEPLHADWQTIKRIVSETGSSDWARKHVLSSRNHFQNNMSIQIPGIDTIYVGHNIVQHPTRRANVHYIDTGAIRSVRSDDPAIGQLTLIELSEFDHMPPEATTNPFVTVIRATCAKLPQFAF